VAYNQARLIFLIALPYRKEYMAFSLSLATFVSIELSFHILFSSASRAHPSQEGLWWTEGNCSGVNIITRVTNKRETC